MLKRFLKSSLNEPKPSDRDLSGSLRALPFMSLSIADCDALAAALPIALFDPSAFLPSRFRMPPTGPKPEKSPDAAMVMPCRS